MKIVSKAPCRVDMAGATLDIWPLYLFHTGAVTVNFAVDRYTTCTLETRSDGEFHITSADLRAKTVFRSFNDLSATAKLKTATCELCFEVFQTIHRVDRGDPFGGPGGRWNLGLFGSHYCSRQRSQSAYRGEVQPREDSRDCTEHRSPDYSRAHRLSGLLSRHVWRGERHRIGACWRASREHCRRRGRLQRTHSAGLHRSTQKLGHQQLGGHQSLYRW